MSSASLHRQVGQFYENKPIVGTSQPQPIYICQADDATLAQQNEVYNFQHDDLEDDETGISKSSILFDLIRQLKTGKDLYRISLPAALLRPESMLEYISRFITPTPIILNINQAKDPEQRFLSVLKWWMGNLAPVPKKGILHSKPYNAILGEVFRCKWIHEDSKTFYVAEQVSHHPPISGVYLSNPTKGFSVSATLRPKSKFHGNSASTIIEGEVAVLLHDFDERYIVEFPTVLARGLIWSTQCLEVYDHLRITCEKTGYSADIAFSTKTSNGVKGEVFRLQHADGPVSPLSFLHHEKQKKVAIYLLDGHVNDVVNIKSLANGGKEAPQVFFKASEIPTVPKFVVPVQEQMTMESRRVWHRLTYAIRKKDYSEANGFKNEVEQEQRDIRKIREHKGDHSWQERYFKISTSDKEKWEYEFYRPQSERLLPLEDKPLWQVSESEKKFIEKYVPQHKIESSGASQAAVQNGKEAEVSSPVSDLD